MHLQLNVIYKEQQILLFDSSFIITVNILVVSVWGIDSVPAFPHTDGYWLMFAWLPADARGYPFA